MSPGESSSEVESSEAEDWPSRFPFSPTAAGAGALIVLAVLLMIFRNAAPEQRGSSSANSVVAQQPNVVQDDRRAQPLKERQQNLAAARAHIQSTDLTAARESLSLVAEVDPDNPELQLVRSELEKAEKIQRDAGKKEKEQELLAAVRKVPGSNVRENLRIYKQLANLVPVNEGYREKEEFYAAKVRALEAREQRDTEKKARELYARVLREDYLDRGYDIEAITGGAQSDRLTLKFVLFNDVWAHNLKKTDFLERARALGFKRVDLTDGWNYHVYWTLD